MCHFKRKIAMKILYVIIFGFINFAIISCDNTTAEEYLIEGVKKTKEHDLKGAKELFDRAIEKKPDYAEAYKYRGRVKYNLNDTKGALNDFTKAIEIDENYAEAYYNRGTIYFYLDNIESACKDFRKADELKYPYVFENYRICDYYN